jgi:hypothetical protein
VPVAEPECENFAPMRRIILLTLVILLVVTGYAQKTADIGIWGGGANYQGDIENVAFTNFSTPALGAFFRYNFNYRTSIRAMFLTGTVAGDGIVQTLPYQFSKGVQDLSLQAEINYLRYMLGNKKASFSSYLLAGFGVMYYNHVYDEEVIELIYLINQRTNKSTATNKTSVIAPAIPFGMGFKFNVGSRLGLGVEYQMRKLLDDRLDNLDDPLAHYNLDGNEVTYRDVLHNNDWAGFLGLHITYKIYLGSKPCPAYDVKN